MRTVRVIEIARIVARPSPYSAEDSESALPADEPERGDERAEHASPILDHRAHAGEVSDDSIATTSAEERHGGGTSRQTSARSAQYTTASGTPSRRKRQKYTPHAAKNGPRPDGRARASRSRMPPHRKRIDRRSVRTAACASTSQRSRRVDRPASRRISGPGPGSANRLSALRSIGVDARSSEHRRSRAALSSPSCETATIVTGSARSACPPNTAGARNTRRQPSRYAPITPIARRSGGGDGVMGRVGAMLAWCPPSLIARCARSYGGAGAPEEYSCLSE